MSAYYMLIAPLMAEVDNQIAMGLLCLDYVVIFYLWTGLQFKYAPLNLFDCRASPNLPTFLITAGVIQVVMVLSLTIPNWLASWSLEGVKRKVFIGWNSGLGVLLFGVYIAGAVLTYGALSTVQYDDYYGPTYCDKEMFQFSAACIGITFGLVWITAIVFFVTTWYPKYCASNNRNEYGEIGAESA